MNRNEQHDDLIDLGTASTETFGAPGLIGDEQGQRPTPGLSND